MDKIILYHGSPNEVITPIYGGGNDKHDYGRADQMIKVDGFTNTNWIVQD